MTAEITFGDYTPAEKENEYLDTVKQLAEFNSDTKSVTLLVDAPDASKEQFKFQRAANQIGKTARLRLKDESGVTVVGQDEDGNEVREGTVTLVFTLSKMHKGRRGKKPAVEGNDENTENGDTESDDNEADETIDESGKSRKKS